ncbi:phage tail protein [Burkholderia cenocepacia]|uniref:phage tail protein n=1 Tax=Burkholderia cenocepacia TaxID=95486 RepID=UPI001AA0B4AB|nr:phage tail protein [Burkholderia cenocepacia]MBO1853976.1 phage tail protein [Burkholderia cenocepacia]MDR5646330.1 phage tail protein [Burkholderia cenocepacia]
MDLLKVEIDVRGALEALAGLPPAAMQAAWRRTLRKTGAWIRSQTAKEVSGATGIQQKLLRQRMYFFMRSLDAGKVWLGLNPLEAHRLGAVRRTKKGMRAGRSLFEGAWRKTKAQPDGAIYRRTGKARTPFEVVSVEWSQTGDPAFRRAARVCEVRLMTVLRQEVNYEIQKATNRAR